MARILQGQLELCILTHEAFGSSSVERPFQVKNTLSDEECLSCTKPGGGSDIAAVYSIEMVSVRRPQEYVLKPTLDQAGLLLLLQGFD